MRIFYAISIDEKTKREISQVSSKIYQTLAAGRLIEPFNYHITLEYIGETDHKQLSKYTDALDEAARGVGSFEIVFARIGSFFRGGTHLIFLEGKSCPDLLKLRTSLLSGKETDDRPFLPHITLFREAVYKEGFSTGSLSDIIKLSDLTVTAGEVSLMESKRINGKLVYIGLHTLHLGRE